MTAGSPKKAFTAFDLIPGRIYRVIREFKDYDNSLHPIGEQWRYLRRDFLPYEDGLTLHIEGCPQNRWIRLQCRPEAHEEIVSNFSDFVSKVD